MESYTGKGRGRVEGMDKATGRAVYAADYYEENMLHLAIVRSAYAHARVLDIDTSKVPETAWVFTAKDIVKNNVRISRCWWRIKHDFLVKPLLLWQLNPKKQQRQLQQWCR